MIDFFVAVLAWISGLLLIALTVFVLRAVVDPVRYSPNVPARSSSADLVVGLIGT